VRGVCVCVYVSVGSFCKYFFSFGLYFELQFAFKEGESR
jgi:hypothetical protein